MVSRAAAKRSVLILAITAACCAAAFEIYARWFLNQRAAGGRLQAGMFAFDPELGWRLNDGIFHHEHTDFHATYTIKSGERATLPERQDCPPGRNIALYGDSFVFGNGVNDNATIASFMAHDGKVCVRNRGVPGYGPDQYWLKYDSVKDAEDINVFIFFTGNDYRDVTARTNDGREREKPYLLRRGGSYEFVAPSGDFRPTPIAPSALRSLDLLYFMARSSKLLRGVRGRIISMDYERVFEAHRRIQFLFQNARDPASYFVIIPSLPLVRGITSDQEEGVFHERLASYLEATGRPVLDTLSIMRPGDYFPREGHTNEHGNRKIAVALMALLSPG